MLRRFLAYYASWKRLFWLDFSCAVAFGLLELAFPVAVRGFIDVLLPRGEWGVTVLAAAGLGLLYLLNAGLLAIVTYWGHMLGINIETEMRRQAFDHVQKLSWSYFDRQRTGHMVSRVTHDLEEIGELAHHGPEDLFIAVMTFAGAFVLMFWLHPPLALMTAIIVPMAVAIVSVFGGRMAATWRSIYARVADFNVRLEENVGGIRVVQAFANEDHERDRFARDNAMYRRTKLDAYRIMAASQALNYIGMRGVQVLIMVAGAGYVIAGQLSAGAFVGFLLLAGVFFRPLEKIAAVIETYPKGMAGFRRFQELLAVRPDIADAPGAVPAPPFAGEVRFEGVTFGYDEGPGVLHGIDLTIHPGETVAFVGPSGAGKTSLLSLLPRFYEPSEGRITLDGRDLREVTLESLRRQIGIVAQDVFLFGGTLRENIAYGRLDATETEIREAADHAQLGSLIARLPEGLDTIVGERGVTLSGGQRQRVAIARAFLRNPPVLILDEATSALDSATEREIQSALERLSEGRTTLVIAHRLATIRNADRIVVMQEGRVVESGRHDDLLARGGAYAALHAA
ncbi:ABC transporter ATP-binding protein [Acidimangrovimonas sediminis]|uniref:ABC transporter ATP-binding protein n=1 Tax=Acidimangrovimonas sediminis TaxID=2056283 RepID=UPI000C802985|nr:ABC transporter ATP-binding protein [Acidimangrovimonas sediminis]